MNGHYRRPAPHMMLPSSALRTNLWLALALAATPAVWADDFISNATGASSLAQMQAAPMTTEATVAAEPAKDGEMPFDLSADNISYDVSGNKVTAKGDGMKQVHVKSERGQVWADQIDYDLAANKVFAVGNVKFENEDKTTLLVERLELTGDMQQGALEHLRLRVPMLGEIAQAGTATVSGTEYTMTDVAYSPCKECIGDRKPWSISSDKVVYRKDHGDMTYKNAVMDVYGVPVMYLPWFRHPLGDAKPTNGLLPPRLGRSDQLGENITLSGYVFSPGENADYTIRNRLMSERGSQFMLERRQNTLTTTSEIDASYLNDTGTGDTRNHLRVEAQKDFTPTRRIGINGEIASDNTYLSEYFDRLDPYLASTVYGEDAGEQHYAALSMMRFQDLNPDVDTDQTAQVYPHLQLDRWFVPSFGGQAELMADVVNIHREDGIRSRRFTGGAEYTRPFMLDDGSKLTLGASSRMDFYMIDNGATNGTITRGLPEATAMWEKPYISPGGYHTIAPQVLAAYSPRGGNNDDKVPNEDSVSYELDTSNLFETSRFAGMDRVETGPRLIYGFDNRWGSPDHTDYRLFVGQSLRQFDDSTLPESGGHATNDSDWVGLVEVNPYNWLKFNNRFRLDNATFNPRRMDTSMQLGQRDGLYLRISHSYLDGGEEELSSEFRVPLTDQLAFRGHTRDDLANKTLLESQGGLVWTRDCYEIEAMVRRRGYSNGDLQPGTDYVVNLRLLTLGKE
ncbi:MAG: LPS-assembly protein LptD [Alphaproteobacteria bacterium]|nr:MAG: LPS-assembly protein LptD [Alphaproteobacteria bacterium]